MLGGSAAIFLVGVIWGKALLFGLGSWGDPEEREVRVLVGAPGVTDACLEAATRKGPRLRAVEADGGHVRVLAGDAHGATVEWEMTAVGETLFVSATSSRISGAARGGAEDDLSERLDVVSSTCHGVGWTVRCEPSAADPLDCARIVVGAGSRDH